MTSITVKALTPTETKLIISALGFVATEEHSTKPEIAVIRKIIKAIEERNSDGTRSLRADLFLVRRLS